MDTPAFFLRRIHRCLLMGLFLLASPMASQGQPPSTGSHIVVDYHSGKILLGQNPFAKMPVASLTKIATAAVALDWSAATQTKLSQMLTVPVSAAAIGGANPVGLQPGDQLDLRTALYLCLIGSDNMAAETVADFVGRDLLRRRSRGGDPVKTFVREMNNLAKKIGARATRFQNAHGMDNRQRPYSCAADMARFCKYASNQSAFRFNVSQKSKRLSYFRNGQRQSYKVKNTNQLLGVDRVDGIKTGSTRAAGPCLALSADRSSTVSKMPDGRKYIQPHRLIVVVLNSPDRFGAGRALLRSGWNQYNGWTSAGRPASSKDGVLAGF